MSHLWLWTIWALLLALLVLATLRMDWLKVWWMDQLRHLPDDVAARDIDPGTPAGHSEAGTRPQAHHVPRPVGIPRPTVHDIHGHSTGMSHHRPVFHRSGSRN